MINFKLIFRIIGLLLLLISGFTLMPIIFSIYYGTDDYSGFLWSSLLSGAIGLPLFFLKSKTNKVSKRDGYLIVTLGWIILCLSSALPYIFTGTIPSLTSALFESTSGLTTTGASVFNDIEALPEGVLFWRSLTQWIGGMGIIVLTVAIFPMLGIGGVELFVAEAPGPTSDKIHPRIKETAKRLWGIYFGLTVLLMCILYFISGMTFFDAINHAMTTMSTGGFSTKNASMAHFDSPIVQYPIIIFMFIAGMNYTVIYFSLKGKFDRVFGSDEFRTYAIATLLFVLGVTASVVYSTDLSVEKSFRDAAFQVISVVTTTGFVSADYTAWNSGLTMFFFMLLFTGACAGSTSGGVKVIRHVVFVKNALLEFKRLLHPRAIIKVKVDNYIVSNSIITHILVFLIVYLALFVIGAILMMIILGWYGIEQPFLTAIGSVATCIGNVGPGIGSVGPVNNFAGIPEIGKFVLSVFMLIGRLELFSVLIILTPYYWKSN